MKAQASLREADLVTQLRKLVTNEAIFETAPSVQGINPRLNEVASGAVYFGTGLCTPSQISKGLPFDILSMLFTAEKIRRLLPNGTVYHCIADTHAYSNKRFDEGAIRDVAERERTTLRKIAQNFKFDWYEVLLISEFDRTKRYVDILNRLPVSRSDHEYVVRELADMEWLRQEKNVCIKVSWIIQATETSLGFDERLFDRRYRELVDENMSFAYVKAGRTLDKHRPKASPYIHVEGEKRILLAQGEDVKGKFKAAEVEFGDKNFGSAWKYFNSIVRLYQELVEPIHAKTLEERIEHIISVGLS